METEKRLEIPRSVQNLFQHHKFHMYRDESSRRLQFPLHLYLEDNLSNRQVVIVIVMVGSSAHGTEANGYGIHLSHALSPVDIPAHVC